VKKPAIINVLRLGNQARTLAAIAVAAFFAVQDPMAYAQPASPPPPSNSLAALDSLVAPIALYPDPLLSQVLVASTYPQEVVAANQWMNQNSSLQGKALVDAAAQQPWDASIQGLVAFPQVLSMMASNINWTTQLGNTFLNQQSAVFDAIQNMRREAKADGALQSTPQQTVSSTTENGQTYIQILPANPQVVYVPQYQPESVWGPSDYYPYPSVVYPSTGAYVATGLLSFGAGVAIGALFNGGGWGWYPGWGGGTVIVNRNFISNNHFNRGPYGPGGRWVHNPARGEAGRLGPGRPGMPGRPGGPANGLMPGRPGGPGNAVMPGRPGAGTLPARPGIGGAERRVPGAGAIPGRPGAIQGRPGVGTMPARPSVGQVEQRLGGAGRAVPHPGGAAGIGQMGNRMGTVPRMQTRPAAPSMPHFNPGRGGFGGGQRFGGASRSMPQMGGRGFGGGGHFGGGRRGGGGRRR